MPSLVLSLTETPIVTSGTNVVIDVWILLLPLEFLIRMERPTREKTALIVIFALGASSCICSIVRLYTIRLYTEVRTNPNTLALSGWWYLCLLTSFCCIV